MSTHAANFWFPSAHEGDLNAPALVNAVLRERLHRLRLAVLAFEHCHARFGEPRIFEALTAMLEMALPPLMQLKSTSEGSRTIMVWFALKVARDVCREPSKRETVSTLLLSTDELLRQISTGVLELELNALNGNGAAA